jgi:hypothetical protein
VIQLSEAWRATHLPVLPHVFSFFFRSAIPRRCFSEGHHADRLAFLALSCTFDPEGFGHMAFPQQFFSMFVHDISYRQPDIHLLGTPASGSPDQSLRATWLLLSSITLLSFSFCFQRAVKTGMP